MSTLKEDMELALEALKYERSLYLEADSDIDVCGYDAITALEARLAAWTDEPLGVISAAPPWPDGDKNVLTWTNEICAIDDSLIGKEFYLHPAEPVIQEGWKLVPIEPTEKSNICAHDSVKTGCDSRYSLAWCNKCGQILHCDDGINDSDLHKQDREHWCKKRVLAFGCAKEAEGGKACSYWCGHHSTCIVSITPEVKK